MIEFCVGKLKGSSEEQYCSFENLIADEIIADVIKDKITDRITHWMAKVWVEAVDMSRGDVRWEDQL